jgi:hypothetical protein
MQTRLTIKRDERGRIKVRTYEGWVDVPGGATVESLFGGGLDSDDQASEPQFANEPEARVENNDPPVREFSYVVAPVGGGKTTLASEHDNIAETDMARTDENDALLKPLRAKKLWPQHNAIWHKVLRKWVVDLPEEVNVVMAHSADDAAAMQKVRAGPIFALDISPAVLLSHYAEIKDGRRAVLGAMNIGETFWVNDYPDGSVVVNDDGSLTQHSPPEPLGKPDKLPKASVRLG